MALSTNSSAGLKLRGGRSASIPAQAHREFSVVIPVYNRPIAVLRAVRSALKQTITPREIIVVEDGSPHPVDQAKLESLDSRVRVIFHETNKGGGAARNTGIAAARSRWVAFLDSDDEWRPTKLERQFACLEVSPDAIAAFTGIEFVDEVGSVGRTSAPPLSISLLDLQRMNVLNTTSSALVRRDALQAVDGFDPGLPSCQDWDLWLKLRSIGTFCIVPEPLVGFFQSGGDRITKNRVAVLGGHARVFYKIRTQLGEFKYFRDVLGYHHLRMAQIYFLISISRSARCCGLCGLCWRPAPSRLHG